MSINCDHGSMFPLHIFCGILINFLKFNFNYFFLFSCSWKRILSVCKVAKFLLFSSCTLLFSFLSNVSCGCVCKLIANRFDKWITEVIYCQHWHARNKDYVNIFS